MKHKNNPGSNDERKKKLTSSSTPHVAVIVLGDVGRSPRMQYHARSLLENKCKVSLIGYDGEDLIPDLMAEETSSNLNIIRFSPTMAYNNQEHNLSIIPQMIAILSRIPVLGKLVYYFMRLIALVGGLYHALWIDMVTVPDCILVQNPPSIPLLLLTYIYCHTHTKEGLDSGIGTTTTSRTRPGLVIDWHNLGFTMFGYSSPYHPIKLIAKTYERLLGPKSDAHLCVTKAMKEFLMENNFIPSKPDEGNKHVNVLHDRPPEFFRKSQPNEIHDVISRYEKDFHDCFPCLQTENDAMKHNEYGEEFEVVEKTLFTVKLKKRIGFFQNLLHDSTNESIIFEYRMRKDRPALVVSSTSWTPDEDFSILLNALLLLEENLEQKLAETTTSKFPKIVVVVTGKGPQKQYYQNKIKDLNPTLSYISIQTIWLSSSDYPLFIGSADLGVSLHTSTSGIDLPMKILDNLGCNVPVCAISFKCVGELIVDNVNGKVFENSAELASTFYEIFVENTEAVESWRSGKGLLGQWRDGIGNLKRWKENWNDEAKQVIMEACKISEERRDNLFFWAMSTSILILSIMISSGLYLFR